MKLVGLKVTHKPLGSGKSFGNGIVTKVIDKRTIRVKFGTQEIDFDYSEAFHKYLVAENEDIQADVIKYIDSGESKSNPSSPKAQKAYATIERISGKRRIFWVFQRKFEKEYRGGYIWAPSDDEAHHHKRLVDVRQGDIILHGCGGELRAVSMAKGACYSCIRPVELLDKKHPKRNDGLKGDCDYTEISKPIQTSTYKDDIIRICKDKKYQPFDKNGNGNEGYLFEIDFELVKIFITESVKYNGYLAEIDYIQEILAE